MSYAVVTTSWYVYVGMKRHGDDNEDKQTDKRPRLHQVTSHTKCLHTLSTQLPNTQRIHQQAVQAQTGLTALPSALARLLLSFLLGRAIPSLLGVSRTARRLCACLYELNLSSCEELDDVRFVSSLVRLRTLDLSKCSEQFVDVSPLSSLTSLDALYLGRSQDMWNQSIRVVNVSRSPLSSLVALETLYLVGCEQ